MKNRLLAVRRCRNELVRLKDDLRALDELLYVPKGSVLNGLPKAHGGAKNGLLGALLKREELEEKYDLKLKWFLEQKEQLEGVLFGVLGEMEARVLVEYYLRGRTWREVSECLGVSESWMFKLHKRAIEREYVGLIE